LKTIFTFKFVAIVCILLTMRVAVAGPEIGPNAAALYKTHCATCHEVPETKAPSIDALRKLPLGKITQALEIGIMQPMAAMLKPDERLAISKWLAAEEDLKRNQWLQTYSCPANTPATLTGEENWGMGTHNRRNPTGVAINHTNLDQLELKWSVALPAVNAMRSLPAATSDTIYLGGADARLLALDRKTACVRWFLNVDSAIRNSLTIERTPDGINTVFFADELGSVYAVDATTGALRWKVSVKVHPTSIVSGSIAYSAENGGTVLVPISLYEVMVAANPKHECCRARGGLTALNAGTGEKRWHFATVPPAEKTYLSPAGTQMWGPSGVAVWNRPTVDAARGLVYFGTGENASSPATELSDSVVALDLKTGEKRWHFQALPGDAWNLACNFKAPSCPKENGPDFDIGASVILVKDGRGKGKDVLLAGQKSGEVFALDPDNKGALLWRHHFSPTATSFNANAGIHHGMASDGKTLYVPIADSENPPAGHKPSPSVHAISVADGKVKWSHRFERGCTFDPADKPGVSLADKLGAGGTRSPWPACSFYFAPSAPPTVANGLVYVPMLDGKLNIFNAADGKLLRVIETNRAYEGSNGVAGHGGAIDVAGVLPSTGQLLIPSGYAPFGQMPGNVLLVYELKKPSK
jgi:polyvinyl alcohol dehydrogenase (cytochrome)